MKRIAFLLIGTVFVASCLFAQGQHEGYRVSPGDELELSVYGEPDLDKRVRVSPEGTIRVPLLGEMRAQGLSAEDLVRKIEELYEKDYLVNPQVSVFIKQYAKVFVIGSVNREGGYELQESLTIMDALALAGGTREHADLSKVRVIRAYEGQEKEYLVNVEKEGETFLLRPSDRVIVEEYGKFSVFGQVKRPGSYYLKKDLGVVEAIALAQGFTQVANQNGVRVVREEWGKKKVIKVPVGSILRSGDTKRDVSLKAGDTIVVPESLF